jgi:hypothetical protein
LQIYHAECAESESVGSDQDFVNVLRAALSEMRS